jgi:putative NIF3 family GTP cyclohydrolase 1 type 2
LLSWAVKARDIETYLRSLAGGWVDWHHTTDGFLAGDPATEVTALAVVWMGTREALAEAIRQGCRICIVHEPLYHGGQGEEDTMLRFPAMREKRSWIEQQGLTVYRCHDVWDQLPGIGILDSWARLLGLSDPVAGEGFVRVFDVEGETAGTIARRVAAATRPFGQEAVELLGNPDRPVRRLALGTGAITPFTTFVDRYGADMAICSDDGFTYWREGGTALDLDIPVAVVNHAVTELAGVESLARHLRSRFPETLVPYLPQRCMFTLIG